MSCSPVSFSYLFIFFLHFFFYCLHILTFINLPVFFPPFPIFFLTSSDIPLWISCHPTHITLLYSSLSVFFSLTCCLTSALNLLSKLFTNSFVFFKYFSFSHVSLSTINPFHHTRYFSTPLIFLLFRIFSTSYSLLPSTSTSFPFSFFCPFICSLYCTTQLILITR